MPEEQSAQPGLSREEIIRQKIYLADTYADIGKYERALTALYESACH